MTDVIHYKAPPMAAIPALIAFSASMVAVGADWPTIDQPHYQVDHDAESYSPYLKDLKFQHQTSDVTFADEIKEIYLNLADAQEPLGNKFQAIWDDNLETLYES